MSAEFILNHGPSGLELQSTTTTQVHYIEPQEMQPVNPIQRREADLSDPVTAVALGATIAVVCGVSVMGFLFDHKDYKRSQQKKRLDSREDIAL